MSLLFELYWSIVNLTNQKGATKMIKERLYKVIKIETHLDDDTNELVEIDYEMDSNLTISLAYKRRDELNKAYKNNARRYCVSPMD